MKKLVSIVAAFCAMANVAAYAQTALSNEVAYRVKNEGFANSQLEPLAQFLTDDMGPRLAASQLNTRAEGMVEESRPSEV